VVNHRPGVRSRVVVALGGLAACLAVCLAACDPVSLTDRVSRGPDSFDAIRNLDLTPRFPQQSGTSAPPPRVSRGDSYFGREQTMEPAPPTQQSSDGEGYELNFENAAVTTVAKVILGDILGVGYIIDPRIQGTVTIASGRPVPKADLVYVLENALRMSNVVLVQDTGGYRLIPAGEASGNGRLTTPRSGAD